MTIRRSASVVAGGLVAGGLVVAGAVIAVARPSSASTGWSCPAVERPDGPVVVAVVDSGVSDGAGLGSSLDPRSRMVGSGPPLGADPAGHGTAMAGIVHGRAPEARLLVLGALDGRARAEPAAVAAAVTEAAADHPDVLNLSLGGAVTDERVVDAIEQAAASGAVVVVAAGNEGRSLDGHPAWQRLDAVPGVVVVAAANDRGDLAARTSWGRHVVDVAAPGLDVATVAPDGRPTTVSGSSSAAAWTSGEIAARLSASGDTCAAVRTVLRDADDGGTAGPRTEHGALGVAVAPAG